MMHHHAKFSGSGNNGWGVKIAGVKSFGALGTQTPLE